MKRGIFVALLAAVLASGAFAASAAQLDTTGRWHVRVTNGGELAGGVLRLDQVGTTVVGRLRQALIAARMTGAATMEAKWTGPNDSGWFTVTFSDDGDSFSGKWGYDGKPAAGDIEGRRIAGAHPAPSG